MITSKKTKKSFKLLSIFFSLVLLLNQSFTMVSFAQDAPPSPPTPPTSSTPPSPPSPPNPSAPPSPPTSLEQTNPTSAPTSDPTTNNPPAPSEAPPNPQETPTPTPSPVGSDNVQTTPSPSPTIVNPLTENVGNTNPEDQTISQNTNTGANSTNNSEVTNDNNTTVSNNNDAHVDNNISIDVNTGNNNADFNTGVGSVQTGNAVASVTLTNNLNSNVTGVGGFETINVENGQTGDVVFSFADSNLTNIFQNGTSGNAYTQAGLAVSDNSITGANSENNSSIQNTNTENTTNNNNGNLVNNININANTGNNSASYNTYGGNVETGDAVVSANIMNILNTNFNVDKWIFGVINILGDYIGNIILPQEDGTKLASTTVTQSSGNLITGANSTNNSGLENNNTYNFNNYNNAQAVNNVETSALTGMNSSSYNTAGGEVTTGGSDVNISENTIANTNINSDGTVWLVFVNKLGQWFGYIIGANPNETIALGQVSPPENETGSANAESGNYKTGANSENNSSVTNNNSETITNTNNGNIINNINLGANTGNNKSAYNTLGGEVNSGQAKIGLNLVNFINTNITAKKLAVLFVNVFGNWTGNIVPPGQIPPGNAAPTPTPSAGNQSETTPQNSVSPTPTQTPSFTGGVGGIVNVTVTNGNSNNESNNEETSTVFEYYATNTKRRISPIVLGEFYNMEYASYVNKTSGTYKRGLFTSPVFAKDAEPTVAGKVFGGKDMVNISWLTILIPLLIFIVAVRRKFVFLNFKVYLTRILEVIL